jgi:hypothetical protein
LRHLVGRFGFNFDFVIYEIDNPHSMSGIAISFRIPLLALARSSVVLPGINIFRSGPAT